MTVKELIEYLNTIPEDAKIIIRPASAEAYKDDAASNTKYDWINGTVLIF